MKTKDLKNWKASGRRIGYFALVILGGVVIMSSISWKANKGLDRLKISIEALPNGQNMVDTSDVFAIIEKSFGNNLIKTHLADIDVERLERKIEENPFVLNAEVYLNGREELKIEVKQRQALFRVMDNNGLNYYMDAEGNRMPLSKHAAEHLVVMTGNIPPHVPGFIEKGPELLQQVFMLGQEIEKDPFLKPMIEQIHVKGKAFVLIPKLGKHKILFGKFQDVENKLERLKTFYEKILPTKGWTIYKTIDLRFENQVVCEK